MAGFRKAKPEQAAVKMSLYGPPGSGKTFSALLFAEGIAKLTGKRIAFVDTERGTDFYAQAVKDRPCHPEAFDFDALYTRSLTEVLKELKALRFEQHAVIVVDSITHLWEAAKAAYTGKLGPQGQIPMHAWGRLKAPYKDMMHFLINSPFHVFILGRQGTEFADEDGEVKAVGVKMKAEGETAYEPHVCLRMEAVRVPAPEKKGQAKVRETVPTAFADKDRSGILQGRAIQLPNFENVVAPLMGILGHKQAQVQSEEEAGMQDAEALARQEREKAAQSRILADKFKARFQLAESLQALDAVSKEITPEVKKLMLPEHVAEVREAYAEMRKTKLPAVEPKANGRHEEEAKPKEPASAAPPPDGVVFNNALDDTDRELFERDVIAERGAFRQKVVERMVREGAPQDVSRWTADQISKAKGVADAEEAGLVAEVQPA